MDPAQNVGPRVLSNGVGDDVTLVDEGLYNLYLFNRNGKRSNIDGGIDCFREARDLRPSGHPKRCEALNYLSRCLRSRYRQFGDINDLTEAIECDRSALLLQPPEQPDRADTLNSLSICLKKRYEQEGDLQDLHAAIRHHHEALKFHPLGHPDRVITVGNLANCLDTLYNQNGNFSVLREAIRYHTESLSNVSTSHNHRLNTLSNLAVCLWRRYEKQGDIRDLEGAIGHHREVLNQRASDDYDRPNTLHNLATCLSTRHSRLGHIQDLEECISLHRETLDLQPFGHPRRSNSLGNLATSLRTRYLLQGEIRDIDEVIRHHRDALLLRPIGHPDRSETFSNLGGCLVSRYEQQGESQDLEDALECFRTALSLKPAGHARRDLSLNNLASCLGHRYRLKREAQDLEEAIRCIQETLHLRSLGHPLRSGSLNNLATCLEDRYGDMGDARDLDQAISYNREALEVEILGHPRRIYTLHALSRCLLRRNERANDLSDLEESITLLQGALDLQPTEHAYKAEVMAELASAYLRYAQLSHQRSKADVAWQLYEKAVSHSTANAHTRYDIARKWVSNSRGESRLLAYRKCLELGDRYILVRSSVRSRLKLLSSLSHSGPTDAAACAIGLGEVSTAVELLEQGRTLLWSQLGRYRTSLDALQEVDKDLAVKFESLSRNIESSTTYLTSADSQTSHSSSEEEASQYRRLTEEWDATLQRIRSIEGFGSFLRATLFSILRQAAAKGPVIILNISQERSDAIIVRSHHDPVLVPLDQVGPDQVGSLSLEFSEAVLLGSERARRLKINSILRVLWDFIQPVVETLQAIGIPKGSRIWWCPTSKLASLPLHAAGPHRGSKPNLPDIYVCSYTPTLTALITGLRTQKEESTASVNPTLLLVAQPEAPGQAPIQSVIEEIRKVHLVVPCIDLLINERGLHREVISQLQSHRWVHFASHGSQNTKEPFESCFHLHDKPLHLLDIIQAHLPNAEFAFLSACHSAAGSKVTPDEIIHLAAGLQFSGFRSVIGTLYAMADSDGPVVAEEVYKYIYRHVLSHGQTKGSLVDFTDAAQGLNIATRVLRQNNVPVERWINFVHIGA